MDGPCRMPVRVIFALDRVSFHFLLSSFAAGQACRSHVRSSIAEPALVLIYLHSETPPHFPSSGRYYYYLVDL